MTVEDAHAKNHEQRSVPLNAAALKALTSVRDNATDLCEDAFVFMNRNGEPLNLSGPPWRPRVGGLNSPA